MDHDLKPILEELRDSLRKLTAAEQERKKSPGEITKFMGGCTMVVTAFVIVLLIGWLATVHLFK
jgi:hypothetical protein